MSQTADGKVDLRVWSCMPGTDIDTPAWVQDAVFYQIFPDRFARSERVQKPSGLEPWSSPPTAHGYKGGDLLGVVEHLDHLSELGVNAIYFNPVFQSASNHRYHTHDYLRVDPMLGGDTALRALLDAAKERGMRVLLDGVFNHASRGFFQFNDILENGAASAYIDWFHVEGYPLNAYGGGALGYEAWWDLPALPKFNTDTPAVREFLMRVATSWLEAGIDGWRLDVPNEIDDDAFWQEFRERCRSVNPDCYLVGEIWGDAGRWLRGDQFDGVMNYRLTRAIYGFVGHEVAAEQVARSGLGGFDRLDASGFAKTLAALLTEHPWAVVRSQLNLLDSHDTPRALTILKGDEAALRLAYHLLFCLPGAPCVYYGDEIGLTGGPDPMSRGTMPWEERDRWNDGLFNHIQRLIAVRHAEPALRGAGLEVRSADGTLLVLERRLDGRRLWVVLNVGDEERTVPAEAGLAGTYRDLVSGRRIAAEPPRAVAGVKGTSGQTGAAASADATGPADAKSKADAKSQADGTSKANGTSPAKATTPADAATPTTVRMSTTATPASGAVAGGLVIAGRTGWILEDAPV